MHCHHTGSQVEPFDALEARGFHHRLERWLVGVHADRLGEITIACLVMRDELHDYREAISLLPSLADAKVVGPLALYSFAEPTS